jgi:hypothetical protein
MNGRFGPSVKAGMAANDWGEGDANFINRRVSRKGVFRHK